MMDKQKWFNVDEVQRKSKELWEGNLPGLKPEALEKYRAYYAEKCVKSEKLSHEAGQFIPGAVQHNLSLNEPFPVAMDKVSGAYIWDIDGNRYTDFLQAGGPTILGSNDPVVRQKVIEVMEYGGAVTGLLHEYEVKLAKQINHYMPHVEMFRMLASGTESDMAAARVARAYTGNMKVIKVAGGYHGWGDQFEYDILYAGSKQMFAEGVPEDYFRHTQAVPINDLEAMRKQLEENKSNGGTACIIVEPFGPDGGSRPVYFDYNKGLRALCDEYGALLVFDEVITGFRVGLGGAAEFFGVTPDLVCFGKAVTGGYPMAGGIGGRREIMEHLAPPKGAPFKRIHVGGTLSANPMSCVGGYISLLESEKRDACGKAAAASEKLCNGIQDIFDTYHLPFLVYKQPSIVHIDVTGKLNVVLTPENQEEILAKMPERNRLLNEFGMALLAEGLVTLVGRRFYLSAADTDDVVDDALDRLDRLFSQYE